MSTFSKSSSIPILIHSTILPVGLFSFYPLRLYTTLEIFVLEVKCLTTYLPKIGYRSRSQPSTITYYKTNFSIYLLHRHYIDHATTMIVIRSSSLGTSYIFRQYHLSLCTYRVHFQFPHSFCNKGFVKAFYILYTQTPFLSLVCLQIVSHFIQAIFLSTLPHPPQKLSLQGASSNSFTIPWKKNFSSL